MKGVALRISIPLSEVILILFFDFYSLFQVVFIAFFLSFLSFFPVILDLIRLCFLFLLFVSNFLNQSFTYLLFFTITIFFLFYNYHDNYIYVQLLIYFNFIFLLFRLYFYDRLSKQIQKTNLENCQQNFQFFTIVESRNIFLIILQEECSSSICLIIKF